MYNNFVLINVHIQQLNRQHRWKQPMQRKIDAGGGGGVDNKQW